MFKKHPAISRKVMIQLRSGTAIEGLVTQKIGDSFVLKGATVHEQGVPAQPADGEIVVEAAHIDYTQLLP